MSPVKIKNSTTEMHSNVFGIKHSICTICQNIVKIYRHSVFNKVRKQLLIFWYIFIFLNNKFVWESRNCFWLHTKDIRKHDQNIKSMAYININIIIIFFCFRNFQSTPDDTC
jgi:hypothetical protein